MLKLLSLTLISCYTFGSLAEESIMGVDSTIRRRPIPVPFPPDPPIIPPEFQCSNTKNYQCWTQWFDIDNPSGNGDRENLAKLKRRYPGKVCPNPVDIEARTLSGLTPEEAGDEIIKSDPAVGFICRKRDQRDRRCADYKVRFSCYPPYCADTVCWTKWYDRDNPSGSGDWENLSNLHKRFRGEICKEPMYIEAVTTDDETPAMDTGNEFRSLNPTTGLICLNREQKRGRCKDYKVRFGCPCGY